MAHPARHAPTPTPPVAITGFNLTAQMADLPPCPACRTGELFRYVDRQTQTGEVVRPECGHVAPEPPPADASEWPGGISAGGLASTPTPPPPVGEPGGHPGDPPGTFAGVVAAARAFAEAALGDRWRRVEVVVIGRDGLPALTVTTRRRD